MSGQLVHAIVGAFACLAVAEKSEAQGRPYPGPGLPNEWAGAQPGLLRTPCGSGKRTRARHPSEPPSTAPPYDGPPFAGPAAPTVSRNLGGDWEQRERERWEHAWIALSARYVRPAGDPHLLPSDEQVRELLLPALVKTLETERSYELLSSSLVALAKVGDRAGAEADLRAVFRSYLGSGHQRVSECAAVSLGILGDVDAVPLLASLLKGEPLAREALGGREVAQRTRTFAAFGLGILAQRTDDNAVRQDIAQHLIDVLELPHFGTRDVKVGAMNALGLVQLGWSPTVEPAPDRPHVADRRALLRYLIAYMDPRQQRVHRTTRKWAVRAHAATAIGRLWADGPPAEVDASDVFTQAVHTLFEMTDADSREPDLAQQSAVLALGRLGNASTASSPEDEIGKLHERIRARLHAVALNGHDLQTESFALLALAETGARPGSGPRARAGQGEVQSALVAALRTGKGERRPWASLALGVLGRSLLDQGLELPEAIRDAVRNELRQNRVPKTIGAQAIALGLMRDQGSAEVLFQRLLEFAGTETNGSIALGVGLMQVREAAPALRVVFRHRSSRELNARNGALALALLGDREVVPELIEGLCLERAPGIVTGLVEALGAFADRRSIAPLIEILEDEALSERARAAAAIALGRICDPSPLPRSTAYTLDGNYRASTPTMRDAYGNGILDIL